MTIFATFASQEIWISENNQNLKVIATPKEHLPYTPYLSFHSPPLLSTPAPSARSHPLAVSCS